MDDDDTDSSDFRALYDQAALRVFVLCVGGRPRLLFPGQTEYDVKRYVPLEPGELVSHPRELAAQASGDIWCGEASEEQAKHWTNGFAAAVRSGEIQSTEPAAFLLLLGEGRHLH